MNQQEDASPSIRRFRIGTNVFLQILLWLAIVGAVNYLSCRRFRQWDYTRNQALSLSPQTTQMLGALNQDVKVTALLNREGDAFRYVSQILERYRILSHGRLSVVTIDPTRDPTALAELRNRLADLRFDEELLLLEPEKGARQVIREGDMLSREETYMSGSSASRGRILEYQVETKLTAGILAAVQDKKPILYIVVDKGPLRRVDDGRNKGDAGGVLMEYGKRYQGLETRPLNLATTREIPQDASAVMMIGPSQDLTSAEIKVLFRDYWERRHGGILLLFDPERYANTLQLSNHLAAYYGVKLENDRVLSMVTKAGQAIKEFEVPVMFLPGSPITKDLGNYSFKLPRQTSSLKLYSPNDDEILKSGNIQHTTLLAPLADFWKEMDFAQPNPLPEERELQDVQVAVAVEKGGGVDQRLRLDSSRMVLVGNASFLDPDFKTDIGVQFVLNSINWVSNREVGGIPPKQAGSYKVDLLESQKRKLERYALRVIPLALFLIGCVVMFFRRR